MFGMYSITGLKFLAKIEGKAQATWGIEQSRTAKSDNKNAN